MKLYYQVQWEGLTWMWTSGASEGEKCWMGEHKTSLKAGKV